MNDELKTCKGMNCGSTDGVNHSLECHAEHAAAIAGGRFKKIKMTKKFKLTLLAVVLSFFGIVVPIILGLLYLALEIQLGIA
jgi:hypothetical protein